MKRQLLTIHANLKYIAICLLFFLFSNTISAQLDTIPPVIKLIGSKTVTIEAGTTFIDSGVTAYDNVEGDISYKITFTSTLDIYVTGIYTITYNVSDSSGNKAIPVIRTIIIVNDLTKPIIKINPGPKGCIELDCSNTPYVDPGATATDNKVPFNLTSAIIVTGYVDTRKIGNHKITYNVQDPSGNKAIPVTRNVCVETTRPHGFIVTPISGGFKIWTDKGMEVARTSYKWNIDGQYLNGKDTSYALYFYPTDNLEHQVCMDETFCGDDTAYRYCQIIKDSAIAPISGKIYLDPNSNCNYDSTDKNLNYIPIKLIDSNGKIAAKAYSYQGEYAFHVDNGLYTVALDIDKLPLEVNCPYPGKDTLIELKQGQLSVKDLDFPLACKSGYDIGVIQNPSSVFAVPGQKFYVDPLIGDLQALFSGECSSNLSGKIKIHVQGKVQFKNSDSSALSPDSINGNEFVYLVSNFSTLKQGDFKLIFKTDTTAKLGDTIKVKISITPDNNDINPNNNEVLLHYLVRTSFDPNMMEVYPVDVEPEYNDWFTYTVHFQNTGNAPAFKVRITDTLDSKLDPETFELLGYSHPVQVGLRGHALVFNFKDINLPDSTSDEKNSHGSFQYRVKPLKNQPAETKINSTSFIFFDYNDAVVTNTAVNTFVARAQVGLKTVKAPSPFQLYPNPGSGIFTIGYAENIGSNASIEIYDLYGKLLYTYPFTNPNMQIDLSAFANGIYICKLSTGSEELYSTFVKQ